ncbi:LOW QUALITY PROTEIN: PiggyBac transposable element-derived protein 3 [Frankliniella fusca]|uniref:PiggyBac transposable element-derived protein 3 n=1 Tax=Frankliniella fusca TaxID=407009 RepID=A0AAE1LW42_9NEOP|nr:LOW QUALITY PROTEIN: PiggyBac transposable element-derived protein 3 [Frankliniella fusca]
MKSIRSTMFYKNSPGKSGRLIAYETFENEPDSDEEPFYSKYIEPSSLVIPPSPVQQTTDEDDAASTNLETEEAGCPLNSDDEGCNSALGRKRHSTDNSVQSEQVPSKKTKTPEPEFPKKSCKRSLFPNSIRGSECNPTLLTSSSPLKERNEKCFKSKVMRALKKASGKEQVPPKSLHSKGTSLSGFDDDDDIPIINFIDRDIDGDDIPLINLVHRKKREEKSIEDAYDQKCNEILSSINAGTQNGEKSSEKPGMETGTNSVQCGTLKLNTVPQKSVFSSIKEKVKDSVLSCTKISTVKDKDLPVFEGAACRNAEVTTVDENQNLLPQAKEKELNSTPEHPKCGPSQCSADLHTFASASCSNAKAMGVDENLNLQPQEQLAKGKELNSTPESGPSRYPTRTRNSLLPVYRDSNSDSEGDDHEPYFPEGSSDSDASSSDEETLADFVKKHVEKKTSIRCQSSIKKFSSKAPKTTNTKCSENHTSNDEFSDEDVIQWEDGDIPLNERPCPSFDDPTELLEPIDYFQYYWDDEIFQYIADQTNLYSVQQDGKSMDVTKKEIQIFLGIWIFMGLCKLPSYEDYWNGLTRVPQVADLMPLKRYEKIRSRLHLADNSQDFKEDKLFKVRPLLTHILNKCRSLEQKENKFSIDESMTLYKGKKAGALRQYMPKKPHKWGFKFFLLCGVSGMVYDFLPYLGSDTFNGIDCSDAEKSLGLSGQIVTSLCKSIKLPRLSMVCFDNYFTSIPLLMFLLDNYGILSTGTVRSNRTSKCPLMDDKSLMKQGRGSIDSKVLENKIVCVKWSDNKTVTLASTMAGVGDISSVKRWSKKDNQTSRIDVPCPDIVRNYNSMMGGVDTFDMLMELYRTSTRAKRWYLPLVGFLISITLVNSWLTYKRDYAALGQKMNANNSKLFRLHIFHSLVTSERRRGRPSCNEPKAEKIIRSPVTPRPVDGERRDNTDHWPGFGEKRQRCRNCTNGFSEVICLKCNMTLCFRKNKNCFVQFHREPKL